MPEIKVQQALWCYADTNWLVYSSRQLFSSTTLQQKSYWEFLNPSHCVLLMLSGPSVENVGATGYNSAREKRTLIFATDNSTRLQKEWLMFLSHIWASNRFTDKTRWVGWDGGAHTDARGFSGVLEHSGWLDRLINWGQLYKILINKL